MSTPLQNAAIIYQVGRSMGMSSRDIQIGIITAMVESNLTNVNHGDRDSLGLFQQRPSQGWGTPEQVMDPVYASRKFFSTMLSLVGEKRFGMGMGEVAQAVQRSAFPERYAERIGQMRDMWPSIMQAAGKSPKSLDGGEYKVPKIPKSVGFDLPNPEFGSVDVPIVTPEGVLSEAYGDMNSGVSPTAKQMLGAWGMGGVNIAPSPNGSVVEQQYATVQPDQLYGDVMPLANTSTNTEIITPMAQTQGGYEKGVDGWRKAVVQIAKTALGTPYVWGGTGLSTGVDCSGLLQTAFAKAGINLPRVSYQQANYGARVGLDALQPGDLVAWDNSSRNPGADHIALYIGNGQVLEAARPGTVVRIRTLGKDEGAWGVKITGK